MQQREPHLNTDGFCAVGCSTVAAEHAIAVLSVTIDQLHLKIDLYM